MEEAKEVETVEVKKGDRVAARWLRAKPLGSFALAGAQMKLAADEGSVTGTVRHLRCSNPDAPTDVVAFIDAEGNWDGPLARPSGCTCEKPHVPVRAAWISAILPAKA